MKKKKIVAIIIISLIIAALAGLIIFLKIGGNILFSINETSDTDKIVNDTDDVKIKNVIPVSRIATVIDINDYNNENDIKTLKTSGFNTFIIQYDVFNHDKVLELSNKLNSYSMYNGIRVSANDKDLFFKSFKDFDTDFFLFYDMNDSGEYFVATAMDFNNLIKQYDPECRFGIEVADFAVISDYLLASAGNGNVDFVMINQNDKGLKEFSSGIPSWYELTADLWINFNLTYADSLSQEETAEIITSINSIDSAENITICMTDYMSIANSSTDAIKALKKYIKDYDNLLEDKSFEIINYADYDITISNPVINFRGTCSPLSELKCNGKKIITAANGDFSVDCDLKSGLNKITFEHKGKTYTYNVTYNLNIVKSVSPSNTLIIPGNMEFEISAVALTGSTVSVSFNGRTFNMSRDYEKYDEETPEGNYSTYKVTFTSPPEKEKEQNLGNFKVNATYNGVTQSKIGAIIKVNSASESYISYNLPAEELYSAPDDPINFETVSSEVVSSTKRRGMTTTRRGSSSNRINTSKSGSTQQTADGNLQKYSYQNNYGLGTAKLVEIIGDYVEVYPGSNLKTNSEPNCSPFLRGTTDYFRGSASIDSDTYYFMNSGYKVPSTITDNEYEGKKAEPQARIVDGYIMPSNNAKILSSTTSDNRTVIKISMNRRVPINAYLTGQNYADNGNGRMVKVNNVTYTGIKFTFYDTSSIYGSLNFSGNLLASGSASKGDGYCTLNISFIHPGKFYGYHCQYDSEGNLVITIKEKPSAISGYLIMIDPGHGGRDPGALCAVSSETWNEASINLSIAEKIKSELEAAGASVILTRSDNSFLSLHDRNMMVRKYHPDLFISVHCNAAGSASSYGVCSFYYRAYSQPLSKCIQDKLVNAYSNYIYSGMNLTGINRGSLFGAYRVTRVEECPSILIEYGFITSVMESQALQNATNRNILAKATADGVKTYINNY